MSIAASSRLLGDIGLPEGVRLLRALGYEGLELWHEWLMVADQAAIEALREADFRTYVHAASRDINLTSSNPRIARASLTEVRQSIDLAERVNAGIVVVHPGRCSSSKGNRSAHWSALLEVMARLIRYAARRHVRLVVENMEARPRELVVSAAETRKLLDSFAPGELDLCLDVAHASTTGHIGEFLEPGIVERTAHVHLSNSAPGETHTPLWSGSNHVLHSGLLPFLQAFEGAIVIEGYDPSRDTQSLLKQNMKMLTEWGLNGNRRSGAGCEAR